MKNILKNGATSNIMRIFLMDSTSTTGAGKTGLTSASSGLNISTIADNEATATTYTAAGSTIETITTLGTYAAPTATKCRFKEVDATNLPGLYEIQLADARYAVSSARQLVVGITCTGVVPVFAEIKLSAVDFNDAVRGGMTALPNANAEAAGGLYTRGTGAGQINQETNGYVSVNLKAILGTVLTETSGGLIAGGVKKFFDISSPTSTMNQITLVDTITTYTGNTKQTGDAYARLGAPAGASVSADIAAAKVDTAAIKVKTDFLPSATAGAAGGVFIAGTNAATTITTALTANITGTITTVTNLTNAPANGDFTAAMKASITAAVPTAATTAGLVWDIAIASHQTAGSTGAALNAAGGAGDPWNTALPGSYALGTAGYIVGSALDATISSRLASATNATSIAAIKAKTDNLPSDPATVTSQTTINNNVLAVKAKTDNLPVAPAATSDIPSATDIADATLNRDFGSVSDTNARTLLNAARALRNKVDIDSITGNVTVFKENDSTTAWTAVTATDAAALPIISVDPS